jgi:hypothetical protein
MHLPGEGLAELYAADAARILEAYRTSSDPALAHFDWHKAEVYLERAVQLGANGDRTLGDLSMARGYATLERLTGPAYSDDAAEPLRLAARNDFLDASRRLPAQSAPHLALARVYVYWLPDPEQAIQEFTAAERLGAVLGPREIEQEGDAYRIRAQQDSPSDRRQAARDADTARGFYAHIPGFDQVDDHVRELAGIHAPAHHQALARRVQRWR